MRPASASSTVFYYHSYQHQLCCCPINHQNYDQFCDFIGEIENLPVPHAMPGRQSRQTHSHTSIQRQEVNVQQENGIYQEGFFGLKLISNQQGRSAVSSPKDSKELEEMRAVHS